MEIVRKAPRGGGHNPSLIALGVLGVMMMAAVIGVVAMDDDKAADAANIDIFGQFTFDGLIYGITSDYETLEVTVMGIDDSSEYDLIIPAQVMDAEFTYNVTSIYRGAFMFSDIRSVHIPNSVTVIDTNAFSNCVSLESVIIPDSVTNIGANAFSFCTALESVEIPNSVTIIDMSAFYVCSELSTVIFNSQSPPTFGDSSFDTQTTTDVYTPGWDPLLIMAESNAYYSSTTIVWANDPSKIPDLTFLSNPVTNGTLTYNPLRTSKTALTA